MTTVQMQYFAAAAKHLSFTRAARELYVSQPSISKQVAALEAELGVALFDRSQKHSLQLTRAGAIFAELFQRMTEEMECAIRTAARLDGKPNGSLRVCMVEGWDLANFLGRMLRAFLSEYPQISLSFETYSVHELLQGLLNGHFDMVICMSRSLEMLKGVCTVPLAVLPGILYCSDQHPMVQKPELQPSDFKDSVCYRLPDEEDPVGEAAYLDYFHSQAMEPTFLMCPNQDSLLLNVDQRSGFSVTVPWSRVLNSSGYRYLFTGIEIPVSLAWNAKIETAVHTVFADKLQELFRVQYDEAADEIVQRIKRRGMELG